MKELKLQSNKHRLATIVSFMTLTLSFIVLAIILYWSLFPYNPLTINERPLKLLDKEVSQGEALVYRLDYCKATDKEVTIRRKFSDGLDFAMPEFTVGTNQRGCRVQNIALEIPHSLPNGDYILVSEFVYQVNPIRKVVVKTHTEKFTVR